MTGSPPKVPNLTRQSSMYPSVSRYGYILPSFLNPFPCPTASTKKPHNIHNQNHVSRGHSSNSIAQIYSITYIVFSSCPSRNSSTSRITNLNYLPQGLVPWLPSFHMLRTPLLGSWLQHWQYGSSSLTNIPREIATLGMRFPNGIRKGQSDWAVYVRGGAYLTPRTSFRGRFLAYQPYHMLL